MKISGFSVGYKGKVLINDVDLLLPETGIFSLLGTNGTGKSSFFRTISGIQRPVKGEIDQALVRSVVVLSEKLSWPQEVFVEDIFSLLDIDPKTMEKTLVNEVRKFNGLRIKELSTGQRKIFDIFTAMAVKKNIVILDEALDGIDFIKKEYVIDYIRKASEHVLFLHTSHDFSEVEALEPDVLLLRDKGVEHLKDFTATARNIPELLKGRYHESTV